MENKWRARRSAEESVRETAKKGRRKQWWRRTRQGEGGCERQQRAKSVRERVERRQGRMHAACVPLRARGGKRRFRGATEAFWITSCQQASVSELWPPGKPRLKNPEKSPRHGNTETVSGPLSSRSPNRSPASLPTRSTQHTANSGSWRHTQTHTYAYIAFSVYTLAHIGWPMATNKSSHPSTSASHHRTAGIAVRHSCIAEQKPPIGYRERRPARHLPQIPPVAPESRFSYRDDSSNNTLLLTRKE